MSHSEVRQKRPPKPPACDRCKARRVLCHSQPDGKPCPRCIQKNVICTTTPVPRGRPRKKTQLESNSEPTNTTICLPGTHQETLDEELALLQNSDNLDQPKLTPDLVAHCFECNQIPIVTHPLIAASSIFISMRSISFNISRLQSTETRVLALCIIAFGSLVSHHDTILGPGPIPDSIFDPVFFSSSSETRNCGVRRAPICRGFHIMALKAARDSGTIQNTSLENAASCFILDLLNQCTRSSPGLKRPWATAYMSHVRVLVPMLRSSTPKSRFCCAAYLLAEALVSTRSKTTMQVTHEDQIMFCGPEAPSLADQLAELEASSNNPCSDVLFEAMHPYMFGATSLARQLSGVIGGRKTLGPLPESVGGEFLASLSQLNSILSHLLTHANAGLTNLGADPTQPSLSVDDLWSPANVIRACGYGAIMGFIGIALPFYREVEKCYNSNANLFISTAEHARRMSATAMLEEAHKMACLAVGQLARAKGYLTSIHYVPGTCKTLCEYAEFALDVEEKRGVVEPERVHDLHLIARQVWLAGYSQDLFADPDTALLVQRLESYLDKATNSDTIFQQVQAEMNSADIFDQATKSAQLHNTEPDSLNRIPLPEFMWGQSGDASEWSFAGISEGGSVALESWAMYPG
ncbi:Zn(2)-C6 fungal-type domain-containing protein [Favolaschia claudopus]|uniref:Zn(2)-C6 fungal-type domain-containing protein n=1 Tax=Favolaschia claudopus TaxID=2862362 RepID=A0AAW0E1G4_9AGAR